MKTALPENSFWLKVPSDLSAKNSSIWSLSIKISLPPSFTHVHLIFFPYYMLQLIPGFIKLILGSNTVILNEIKIGYLEVPIYIYNYYIRITQSRVKAIQHEDNPFLLLPYCTLHTCHLTAYITGLSTHNLLQPFLSYAFKGIYSMVCHGEELQAGLHQKNELCLAQNWTKANPEICITFLLLSFQQFAQHWMRLQC